MCQLLGMNCNTPTDICFSFTGFQARGGLTDHHRDGWGIGFFEGQGCRLFVDPRPSVDSPVAALVRHYPIRSLNVIAHIRKATHGRIALENTHPFVRELWGQYWLFAHNGDLKDFAPDFSGRFLPVGDTDSERAFCHILDALSQAYPATPPPLETLHNTLVDLATGIGAHGEFNFLLSNGRWLFAHCASRLAYIVREAPFTKAHLMDQDVSVDFNEVTTPADRVAVVATTPLTDNEAWTSMPPGTLLTFESGQPHRFDKHKTKAFINASCTGRM